MKKMPDSQKRAISKMDAGEIMDFQIRLQVECGMTEQDASDYIEQAFSDETEKKTGNNAG